MIYVWIIITISLIVVTYGFYQMKLRIKDIERITDGNFSKINDIDGRVHKLDKDYVERLGDHSAMHKMAEKLFEPKFKKGDLVYSSEEIYVCDYGHNVIYGKETQFVVMKHHAFTSDGWKYELAVEGHGKKVYALEKDLSKDL